MSKKVEPMTKMEVVKIFFSMFVRKETVFTSNLMVLYVVMKTLQPTWYGEQLENIHILLMSMGFFHFTITHVLRWRD
ncbi:MAG: hypothetical protein WCR69_04495 [Sulfuricurvum sp.]|jgi:hypothetical protein